MPNGKKDFMRTLCVVSAMMASMSFVGVGVMITIFYETLDTAWKNVAYLGAMAIFFFAFASVLALMYLEERRQIRRLRRTTVFIFGMGWLFFYILILALLWALSV